MISFKEFLGLPNKDVARLVEESKTRVCVFPINGTRRWFLLEHGDRSFDDPVAAYMDLTGQRHIEIYRILFEHGLRTLIAPMFGQELTGRGDDYIKKIGATGLARLADHPDFVDFYEEMKVRIHFYGDYREKLRDTPYAYLSDIFDNASRETSGHTAFDIYYGIFGNDATESVARIAVNFFQSNRRSPSRSEIVQAYYGGEVGPADLFIGFDKFSVFDYPLLGLGEEDLYFTAAPSLYMDKDMLRAILYDHLFTRKSDQTDYTRLPETARRFMKEFYTLNRGQTLGTGFNRDGIWYPSTQIQQPIRKDM